MEVKHEVVDGMAYTWVNGVKGTLRQIDYEILKSLALDIPRGGIYVETGSYMGCSAVAVGLHARGGVRVYAHDIWVQDMEELVAEGAPPPREEDYFYKFYKGVRDNGLTDTIIPIRGDSKWSLGIHEDESVDVAFVDGDHSYEGALGDLQVLWSKMKPGAPVVIHDSNMEPVMKAVKEFAQGKKLDVRGFHGTDMLMITKEEM